ncbi:Site-specific recombinase XerC (XerC) [Commensalibacter communis]|uniref:tyrosine-type recombinase/integrase n=1 Tax=Commensalibacter communis TaxID=2972786 RepID=UPI0022FF98A8|nr:tyrosine-type recombinase/integrase [Commensalibacter communis]CAI3947555.1 Site-specific recombinase XerC (XerC) [Commensalibacter communis]
MLVRRPSGYSYRRKIPILLREVVGRSEIWFSLNTNNKVIANNRACVIHSSTNVFFAKLKWVFDGMSDDYEDLGFNEGKHLRPNFMKDYTELREKNQGMVEKLYNEIDNNQLETFKNAITNNLNKENSIAFSMIIIQYEHWLSQMRHYYRKVNTNFLLTMSEYGRQFDAFAYFAVDEMFKLKEVLDKYKFALEQQKDTSDIEKKLAELLNTVATMNSAANKQASKRSILFSEASEVFISASSKSWKDSDLRGYRNSIKRFVECCGDKEIHLYTGLDVGNFKELMEQLPANYGRNPKDKRTVGQLIEDADTNNLERVSGKSVKNHFSRLSTIWSYYTQRDIVEKNIFSGWRFDTKQKIKRIPWSDEYLKILIEASFDIKSSVSKETYGYIVGVASYTGMRLEEICRIRVQDIQDIHNIPCINICEHKPLNEKPETAWNPKTEAGERVVPISQKLIDAGFLDYIKNAKKKKEYYIFSELEFSGKDNKRSALFQRNFSKFKTKLGIPETTVFHSFRHNISTQLRNIHEHGDGGLRDVWIDSFLGHEGINKSVGNTVYFNAANIQNLKKVADAVIYPDFWDIKELKK